MTPDPNLEHRLLDAWAMTVLAWCPPLVRRVPLPDPAKTRESVRYAMTGERMPDPPNRLALDEILARSFTDAGPSPWADPVTADPVADLRVMLEKLDDLRRVVICPAEPPELAAQVTRVIAASDVAGLWTVQTSPYAPPGQLLIVPAGVPR